MWRRTSPRTRSLPVKGKRVIAFDLTYDMLHMMLSCDICTMLSYGIFCYITCHITLCCITSYSSQAMLMETGTVGDLGS